MLKRLTCLLLAILMITSLLPVSVFADSEDIQLDTAFEEPVIQNSVDFVPAEPDEPPVLEPQAPIIPEPPAIPEPTTVAPAAESEPPTITEPTAEAPAAEPEQPELPDPTNADQPAEEQEELFENMLLLSDLDADMSPYAAEPAPGNVNKMPTGLGLEVSISNSAPAVGDTVTYTLAPTGVTPSGNSRPLTEYGFKYKYSYGVMQFVDGEQQFIIDPNSQPFQESNVFSVTFPSSNEYVLYFYLMEMYPSAESDEQYHSTTERRTIHVTPTGEGRTVEQAADEVAAQCKAALPNGSQYDYALWLHDWILANCTYDYSGTGVLCSAEGVFFYGTGTCAAYRAAYKMLLDRVGIQNERCTGNGHEWNAVLLDGKWYQIDVTWDDVDYSEMFSYYKHLYFGLNDELMQGVHSEHSPNPACPSNSLEQNYFIKTGQIHAWSDGFEADIIENLKAGNKSFSLPVTTAEPDSTKRVIYGIAAYELSTREWLLDDGNEYSLGAQYKDNALHFTAKNLNEPEPQPDYSLDNIAQLHGGKAVTLGIDGMDCYPDSNGGFGSVELAEGERLLVTAAEYNLPLGSDVHQMYPTGMYVYSLEKNGGEYSLDRLTGLDNLLSYGGSSIRITGNKGIRMITGIESSIKSALTGSGVSGYTLEEYGTLLCWSSEIQNGSLSLGDSYARHNYAYSRAAGTDPVFRYSGSKVQYTNVLVGFSNAQCVDDIAMRSYIKLTDPAGEQVTLYGGIVRRSIGYIAYQNRSAFSPGTAAYEYIWDIIHYVYGDMYDADYRG